MPEFDGVAEGVVEHRPLAPLGRPGRRLPGQGLAAGGQRQPHGRGVFQIGDRKRGACGPVERGGDLGRRADVAGGRVARPAEQRLPQHLRLGGTRLLARKRDGDGDQGLGDRPAGDRGEVRPFDLGVGAGVGVPGDHFVFDGLGVGQAGAGAEGPPVADRVLQFREEPVGQRAGLERLAVLAPVDRPPDPEPGGGAVAEPLDVPEPDVVTVHRLLSPVPLACPLPGGAATRSARCAGPGGLPSHAPVLRTGAPQPASRAQPEMNKPATTQRNPRAGAQLFTSPAAKHSEDCSTTQEIPAQSVQVHRFPTGSRGTLVPGCAVRPLAGSPQFPPGTPVGGRQRQGRDQRAGTAGTG